ncbi:radical SAM protein [Lachnospiraceae bacterium C1.1]
MTNACNLRCSNCTRFCGNHKKPFLMDIETFRKAVDSLKDFDGVTGIIGGEPTLHPDFENFALYMQSVHTQLCVSIL